MPSKKRADDAIPAGFPAQRQDPPGLTSLMRPQPDHGEQSYQGTGKLQGRHALVTGGDSGIGRAVALAYAREGADVAFTYLPEEEPDAQVTVELVTSTGRGAVPIETDLTSREGCDAAVRQTVAALGAIDILVNNAGYQQARDKSVERMSDERFDRVLRTNLYALLWTIRAALPHMPRGSCIINTSSTQAYHPSRPLLDYAATKAAINNLTVNLAADLGPRGIRVNAVAPGPIWTPLQPATQPAKHMREFGSSAPLGRAGQPAEVAPAYVFLASEADASFVSGTVLGVTGGQAVF